MTYRVLLLPRAKKFYATCDRPLAAKLAKCFLQLEQKPYSHSNTKPLRGKMKGYYRYRIGDRRVIYTIDAKGRVVIVAVISHRGGAYPQ